MAISNQPCEQRIGGNLVLEQLSIVAHSLFERTRIAQRSVLGMRSAQVSNKLCEFFFGLRKLHFMLRVGFDAFELSTDNPEEAYRVAAEEFSAWYQPGADGRPTAMQLRMRS